MLSVHAVFVQQHHASHSYSYTHSQLEVPQFSLSALLLAALLEHLGCAAQGQLRDTMLKDVAFILFFPSSLGFLTCDLAVTRSLLFFLLIFRIPQLLKLRNNNFLVRQKAGGKRIPHPRRKQLVVEETLLVLWLFYFQIFFVCYFDDENQCPVTHMSPRLSGFTSNCMNSPVLTSEKESKCSPVVIRGWDQSISTQHRGFWGTKSHYTVASLL